MKKTVKSLIIAASVAAVAGIGAVSFAAWSSTNATSNNQVGGPAGSISTAKGVEIVKVNGTDVGSSNFTSDKYTETKKLFPVDQTTGVGDNLTYVTIEFKVKADLAKDMPTSITIQGVATESTAEGTWTAPTMYYSAANNAWDTSTAITTAQTVALSTLTKDETGEVPTYTIYVGFKSDNVLTDMNSTYTITLDVPA